MKFLAAISAAILALTRSANALPELREAAPQFKDVNAVVGYDFQKISLDDYKGKYLVIVFYPFDFTYVCPTELIKFSDNVFKFRGIGAEIIGVSTDSHYTHLAWVKTPRNKGGLGRINYPLLADIGKNMSRDYGVLVDTQGDPMRGAALRGMFIIDDKQNLRSFLVNDDSVGRNVDEAFRLIEAFKFADKKGQVCPANWKSGDNGIIPDQKSKLDYFKNLFGYDEFKQMEFPESGEYPEPMPTD